MLDNNWWNNVKRIAWIDCSAALQTEKGMATGSAPPYLPHSLSPASLPIPLFCSSLSLPLCVFIYGRRQFHIARVPTAVWVSACVSLCQHHCGLHESNSGSTNPMTAELFLDAEITQ